ncbi:MAG: polysaccharide deacetylase family protein [Candidatus Nanoarchaeia archaeon]
MKPVVHLAFSYDTESPFGKRARTPEGRDFRKRQIELERKVLQVLNQEEVPRTYFILGTYLEGCLEDFSASDLRELYDPENPLNDLQQHTYSHELCRPIPGRTDKNVMSTPEFVADLKRANETLSSILGVQPDGLRTPLGYCKDLSDMPHLLLALNELGFSYVSSNLRSEELEKFLFGELNSGRQPHTYHAAGYPRIVEIPSHGLQDPIFTREKAHKLLGKAPKNSQEILSYYTVLFNQALQMAEITQRSIYIGLCLHQWAIAEYDPQLDIHRAVIDKARKKGIGFLSHAQIKDEILASENL